MKNFYVSCSVKYTDPENGQNDVEFYSSTIQANSKKIAEKEAKDDALKIFNEELNEGFYNITVNVDECYETSDDARSS
jgi:hypothetical protein